MAKKNKNDKNDKKPAPPSVRELLRVGPGFDLAAVDARRVVAGPKDKVAALAEVGALEAEVSDLQERLYAESRGGGKRRLLVVL